MRKISKRGFGRWAVLIFVCAAAGASVEAADIGVGLVNPGFDDPKSSEPPECDEAMGWVRWGSWANRHTNAPEWRTRNGSGMIAYHHWLSDSANVGWYQDVADLSGGSYYRFSTWARWQSNCNANNVELRLEPYGGGAPYRAAKYGRAAITDSWTYIVVQGRIPPDAKGLRVVILCTSGFGGDIASALGGIEFDDASLNLLRGP